MPECPAELLLEKKRILVTGASSGIGLATVQWLAKLGAQVTLSGRRTEALQSLAEELPGAGHVCATADLTLDEDRMRLADEVSALDGLVHAAGLLRISPVSFLRDTHLREMAAIHHEAPLLLVRALMKNKKLEPGAGIVFITSVAARSGALGHAAYAGAKAALEGSARCLAMELASRRIRVNCLAPGMVRTPMADDAEESLGDGALRKHEQSYPLGFGAPMDVARTAGFLLSPAASWITGTVVTCDGGFTAGRT